MEAERRAFGYINESVNKSFSEQEPSGKFCSRTAAAPDVPQSATVCFDCSICLDSAVDPVVTLCGHLYCWPCIYRWMHAEAASSPRRCPSCKSPLSLNSLVPLYGRGSSSSTKAKNLDIPNRAGILRNSITSSIEEEQQNSDEFIGLHRPPMQQHPRNHYYPSFGGGAGMFSWTSGGVLGGLAVGLLLPLLSRRSNHRGEPYSLRSSQLNAYGTSVSQRRQEKRTEIWLHQICVFLFCCVVSCLLFF